MKEQLIEAIKKTVKVVGIDPANIRLEYPENVEHGDYSCNVALTNAKSLKTSPKSLAEKIVDVFNREMTNGGTDFIESVNVAGPGFINFKLRDKFFVEKVVEIARGGTEYGWGSADNGKKIMVEYTDPNPFKIFHIGHLMANAIGESISRLIQSQGAEVKRANWQGDVGPHVAKAIWGAKHNIPHDKESREEFWGRAYAVGAKAYDANEKSKEEINDINRKIYDRSDPAVNSLYDKGRKECLEAFERIYALLDTRFDNYFFESKEGRNGEAVVKEFLKKGIFEESDGAIVFKGEKYGLHTRVFITSKGLPTYETKELGLNAEKFKLYPDLSESIIVTANEQSDYFKVLLKAMSFIMPEIAGKTKHLSHGLLRLASSKMSSRTGNIIAAESLIEEIKVMVKEKMGQEVGPKEQMISKTALGREKSGEKAEVFTAEEIEEISDQVSIAAIKYTILRQSIGGDVIFDSAQSISFEGDSGPYLQYSAVRAGAVLKKVEKEVGSIEKGEVHNLPEKAGLLEKLIVRFPDIVERARAEYAPQLIATYLINLCGAFNGFYTNQVIVNKDDKLSPYYVALTRAFRTIMTNGLWLLGIKVPKRM